MGCQSSDQPGPGVGVLEGGEGEIILRAAIERSRSNHEMIQISLDQQSINADLDDMSLILIHLLQQHRDPKRQQQYLEHPSLNDSTKLMPDFELISGDTIRDQRIHTNTRVPANNMGMPFGCVMRNR